MYLPGKHIFRWLLFLLPAVAAVPAVADRFAIDTRADTYDVNPGDGNCADPAGDCSLRAAITEANALAGPDTVELPDLGLPYRLSLGTLEITDNGLLLRGSDLPIIDGSDNPPGVSSLLIRADSVTITGIWFRRARGDAIRIEGADNRIGTAAVLTVLTENGLDRSVSAAIRITGETATGNRVENCIIGLDSLGNTPYPNRHGIVFERGASGNTVAGAFRRSGCVISGNAGYGVVFMLGAHHNSVSGATIGPDITGETAPGNDSGGILITGGAHHNVVGGDSLSGRCHIAGNRGDGIRIAGFGCDSNLITGNLVGLDLAGRLPLANHGNGVTITGDARDNRIGGIRDSLNVISGNAGDGIRIAGAGVTGTRVVNNLIGSDSRGLGAVPNGTSAGNGITLADGASYNQIGGGTLAEGNLVGGNVNDGIRLTGPGTGYNTITANFVGVNIYGTSSLINGNGIVIANGAHDNTVGGTGPEEGNIISGNRGLPFPYGVGVLITGVGSVRNRVIGNFIGTDYFGARALRNGTAGVMITDGAQYNVIGGTTPAEGNLISGNRSGSIIPSIAAGVHLSGTGTAFNRVLGNHIGVPLSGQGSLPNRGHGIGITEGATDNRIGGSPDGGNLVASNAGHGILVSGPGTRRNIIRYNIIRDNDSLGIAVRSGAQGDVQPPELVDASTDRVVVTGGPPGSIVDIYRAASDPSGYGEGTEFLVSDTVDESGVLEIALTGVDLGDTLTAQLTDPEGNSSGFGRNRAVDAVTAVDDTPADVPFRFGLHQNYPNPFNPSTVITYTLPYRDQVRLSIYNSLGQLVRVLVERTIPAGDYRTGWDGTDTDGQPVASGVYFYRLETSGFMDTRKMLLVR